jgi:hypothetical protein
MLTLYFGHTRMLVTRRGDLSCVHSLATTNLPWDLLLGGQSFMTNPFDPAWMRFQIGKELVTSFLMRGGVGVGSCMFFTIVLLHLIFIM